jgi:FixJ family two-component response regulator
MYNRRLLACRVIFLPMTKKDPGQTIVNAATASAQRALLAIVDDDESIRAAIGSLFRSMGFRTELFGGGADFLASPNLRRFSCLILDLHMPGMDGLELQRQLAAASHPIPIIFVTAFGDETAREHALRGGAASFLSKPFSEETLLGVVQSAIEIPS